MTPLKVFTLYIISLYILSLSSLSSASTLEDIIERDELVCGVRGGSAGFARIDDEGEWAGLDADYCKALAAAVLKDQHKVDYLVLSTSRRFSALRDDEIDVLIRNTTWTYNRDVSLGIDFVGINFYDGQGFIAWKNGNKTSLKDFGPGTSICIEKGTTTLTNMKSYIAYHDLDIKILEFISSDTAEDSFFARRCDLYSTDLSILSSLMGENAINSKSYVFLTDRISKEPLGPAVRDNDSQWRDIVRWTLYATIEAEEKGITKDNVDRLKKESKDPSIRFLLGTDSGVGNPLGLDDEWVYRILKSVGNYGEIFDRNMGANSKIGLERGLNDLWTRGGLMYSPPMR
ncbi:MAG: general L-amino acid transport system substrate-binding protein [Candidatus Endobugula sp.]|jgi:general L-amino acid transport system substrate-binding protein